MFYKEAVEKVEGGENKKTSNKNIKDIILSKVLKVFGYKEIIILIKIFEDIPNKV